MYILINLTNNIISNINLPKSWLQKKSAMLGDL